MRSTPCVALVVFLTLTYAGCAGDAAAPEPPASPVFASNDPLPPEGDDIYAAVHHSCAILTGSLRCWGGFPAGAQPSGSFVEVTGGDAFGCALATSGSAVCWGTGEAGEIDAPAATFADLGSGTAHTCGVTTAGDVTCWGANDAGQSDPPAGTWALVDAGGSGTVDGAGDYAFVVTAVEGGRKGVDAFRIRITDRTSGSVVFDNERGEADGGSAATPLDGVRGDGAIVMQTK